MRSSRLPSSVRVLAWALVSPFLMVGAFMLFTLGFGILAVTVQLLAELLKHAGA